MFCDGIAQQNHVDAMVKRLLLRKPSALLFHPRETILNDTVSRNGLTSKVSAFLECIAFALRAWRSYLARNWPGEMLYVPAGSAFPAERSKFGFAREKC